MASKLLIVIALSQLLCPSEGLPQETDPYCYFPLERGNVWSFSYIDFPGIFPYAIADTLVRAERVYYSWDSPMRFDYVRDDSAGHIFQYLPESQQEVLLFDFTAEVGDTNHVELEGVAFDIILVSKSATIRAASQTFTNCLHYTLDWFPVAIDDEQQIWLAPGVGPIAMYTSFDTPAYLDTARIEGGCGESRVVTVGGSQIISHRFELSQNYPNPFNPETTITYELAEPGRVILAIYNILGQRVDTLVDEWQPVGSYEVTWDGRNETTELNATSGVYFFQLRQGDLSVQRKMALIR